MVLEKLRHIKKDIQQDQTPRYGYYGSQALFLKRELFWKRFQIALSLYGKHGGGQASAGNVLDFGCQFAFVSAALAQHVKHIYLTEISQLLLDYGIAIHQTYGNQNFTPVINPEQKPAAYLDHIPAGEKIDLFLMFDVLEHVQSIDVLLDSVRTIASDQARLLISLPTENFFYMLLNRFQREVGHCHRYFEIEASLKKKQFRLVQRKGLWGLFNIYLYEL